MGPTRVDPTIWSGLRPATAAAYARDLEHLAEALGEQDGAALLVRLVDAGPAAAADAASRYIDCAGLSPATISRRLAALAAAITGLRLLGIVEWDLPRLRQRRRKGRVRDVAGPPPAGMAALLEVVAGARPIALRDATGLRLSWDHGLRRAELVGLQLQDWSPPDRLRVAGKGGSLVWLTLTGPALAALRAWLDVRGDVPGPLLVSCDSCGEVSRPLRPLQAGQWWRRLRGLGVAAGVDGAHPHGLRHGATTALLRAGVPVPAVAQWLRHASLATVQAYHDQDRDVPGAVASLAAAMPAAHPPAGAARPQLGPEQPPALPLIPT